MSKVTAAILTRNSAQTLKRALDSVRNFDELLILDGGSTDETVPIAEAAGARVIYQDPAILDANGRLKDFAAARNHCIRESKNDWIFFLDSDEAASTKLVEEIRRITEDAPPAVYWVPRKYVHQGVLIERSIAYPNRQMRFFNRHAIFGYRKPVHERLEPHDGVPILSLTEAILVPLELDHAARTEKMHRYIEMELDRVSPLTLGTLYRTTMSVLKSLALYATRFLILLLPPYMGARMPFTLDIEAVRYQKTLLFAALARVFRRKGKPISVLEKILVALTLFIVLFAGTYKLSESPAIWYDEGFYTQLAMNVAERGTYAIQVAPDTFVSAWSVTGGYPFVFPIAASYALFGPGVIEGRAVMAAFLGLFAIAGYVLVRNSLGVGSALASLFLVASFPMLYGNGKSVLGEVPGLFFLVVSLITLLVLERRGFRDARYAALAGLFTGLCVATKPIFILFLPALFAAALLKDAFKKVPLASYVAGIAAFLAPMALWGFLQFSSGDSLQEILAFYTNPYGSSDVVGLMFENALRFVTESSPFYLLALLLPWSVAVFLRRRTAEDITASEYAAFAFSWIVVFAYLRTPGWYRYFFPASIVALLYAPYSILWLYDRAAVRIPMLALFRFLLPLALFAVVLGQLYMVANASFVASYYQGTRTASLHAALREVDAGSAVFLYNVPEVAVLLTGRHYYQYLIPHTDQRIGEESLAALAAAIPDIVIVNSGTYAEEPMPFSRYRVRATVNRYSILERIP